jgi:hypothetical protein
MTAREAFELFASTLPQEQGEELRKVHIVWRIDGEDLGREFWRLEK